MSVSRVSAVQYRLLETLQCHFTSTQRAVDAFSEIYSRLSGILRAYNKM